VAGRSNKELYDESDRRMDGWADDDLGAARRTGGGRCCPQESVQEEIGSRSQSALIAREVVITGDGLQFK